MAARAETVRTIFDSIGTQSCYKRPVSGGFHVPHAVGLESDIGVACGVRTSRAVRRRGDGEPGASPDLHWGRRALLRSSRGNSRALLLSAVLLWATGVLCAAGQQLLLHAAAGAAAGTTPGTAPGTATESGAVAGLRAAAARLPPTELRSGRLHADRWLHAVDGWRRVRRGRAVLPGGRLCLSPR